MGKSKKKKSSKGNNEKAKYTELTDNPNPKAKGRTSSKSNKKTKLFKNDDFTFRQNIAGQLKE